MANPKQYSEKIKRKDGKNNSGLQIPAGSFNMMENLSVIKPLFEPHFKSMFASGMEIHAKLEISHPDDPSEMQADEMADSFMRGDAAQSQQVLSKPAAVSMKGKSGAMQTTDAFDQQLQRTKGQGQKLDDETRSELEDHTGTDLSDVNIHTGPASDNLAGEIGAVAFAHGKDIHFKDGQYNPESEEGKKLLAHEVAHTVQEGAAINTKIQKTTDEKRPVLTDEQQQYLVDLGYNPDSESDHFLNLFVNWWRSRLEMPDEGQIDFLSKYIGIDLISFTERQLKDLKSLLDLATTSSSWQLTYPNYDISTLRVADRNIGSLFLLEDKVSSFGSIAFWLRGEYPNPPQFFTGHFGSPPEGLLVPLPTGISPGEQTFSTDLINVDIKETGKGSLKNKKGIYDYQFFKSALFKAYDDKQLWYTLNKDPQYGFVIGNGVSGKSVHIIQDALQKLNPGYTISPDELKNWNYGVTTTAAVRQFQYEYDVKFGVEEEGRAGAARKLEKDLDYWAGSMARQNAVTTFEKQYGNPNLDTDGIVGSRTLDAMDKALQLREQRAIEEQQIKAQKQSDALAEKNNKKNWENLKTWKPNESSPEIPIIPVPPMNYSNLRAHFIDPSLIEFTQVSQGAIYNPLSVIGLGKENYGVDRVLDPTIGTRYQVKYWGVEVGFFTVRFVGTQQDGESQADAVRKFVQTFDPEFYPEKYTQAFTIGVEGPLARGAVLSDDPRNLGVIADIYAYGFPGYRGGPTAGEVAGISMLELTASPYLVNSMFRSGPVRSGAPNARARISPGSSTIRPPGYQQEPSRYSFQLGSSFQSRHVANKISINSTWAKNQNTVALRGVDYKQDLKDINSGLAEEIADPVHGTLYRLPNGNTYYAEEGNLKPVSGGGYVDLSRGAIKVLGIMNDEGLGAPRLKMGLGKEFSQTDYNQAFDVYNKSK